MTSRRTRRDQWRKTNKGTWTISLGSRGQRIRLFQNRKDGVFYREVFRDGRKDRQSLGTSDRDEAERLGKQLLSMLLSGQAPRPKSIVRLGALADAFVKESPMFLDNAERTKADQVTRIAILRAVIGDNRDVSKLTENDVRQYEARRRSGGIAYGVDGLITRSVRQRSVQADVKLLKQMLRWACTRTMGDGDPWLAQNPLQYVTVKGEADVRRPVASYDRYEATRDAMQKLQERYAEEARGATKEGARRRAISRCESWIRAELGLFLLEVTGRRRRAVMGLRWSDFDFTKRQVTWQAEYDKKKRQSVVPYSEGFFQSMREFQRRLGSAGGFLFPRSDSSDRPAPPELLSQWIRKAEELAELPKLDGSTCHAYRRKWRSERNHLPIKAVAVAGGWTDIDTMIRCYDHPDEADILLVTSEARKRRELATA